MSTPVRWGPSQQGKALLGLVVVAVAAAIASREPALLALATPSLWTLVTTARSPEPAHADVSCPEVVVGEEERHLGVSLLVSLATPVATADATLAMPSSFEGTASASATHSDLLVLDAQVVPHRWGRHRLGPVRLVAMTAGGLRSGRADLRLPLEALVRPRPEHVAGASAPAHLPNRLGEHPTRVAGHGVEPLAVRPYSPGDSVRRINWRVSSRRQQLHVTVAAAERAVDLVLVIDALSDVIGPRGSSLDASVRAATGVADRWLQARDRVGVVVLGGKVRWLAPSGSRSQLDRVADAVLWSWSPPGGVEPDARRVPRSAIPSGAVVLLFTPLLEAPAVAAVAALRERSSRVLVVDVLGGAEPPVARRDQVSHLTLRLWRLERAASLSRLRALGTPVLQPGDADLDRLIALALRGAR